MIVGSDGLRKTLSYWENKQMSKWFDDGINDWMEVVLIYWKNDRING